MLRHLLLDQKGAIAVEAAVVLPVFLSVLFFAIYGLGNAFASERLDASLKIVSDEIRFGRAQAAGVQDKLMRPIITSAPFVKTCPSYNRAVRKQSVLRCNCLMHPALQVQTILPVMSPLLHLFLLKRVWKAPLGCNLVMSQSISDQRAFS